MEPFDLSWGKKQQRGVYSDDLAADAVPKRESFSANHAAAWIGLGLGLWFGYCLGFSVQGSSGAFVELKNFSGALADMQDPNISRSVSGSDIFRHSHVQSSGPKPQTTSLNPKP